MVCKHSLPSGKIDIWSNIYNVVIVLSNKLYWDWDLWRISYPSRPICLLGSHVQCWVSFIFKNSFHSSLGLSPNELIFGHTLREPLFLISHPLTTATSTFLPFDLATRRADDISKLKVFARDFWNGNVAMTNLPALLFSLKLVI